MELNPEYSSDDESLSLGSLIRYGRRTVRKPEVEVASPIAQAEDAACEVDGVERASLASYVDRLMFVPPEPGIAFLNCQGHLFSWAGLQVECSKDPRGGETN